MIPLVWNGMMSFGGGWFFLTASEALSVNNHQFALPGIGAYVAAASDAGELSNVLLAIAVMIVMVVGVNVLFWRPLTAWAERFRVEESEGGGGAPQPDPRLAAALPHSARGRAPARAAGPPDRPGDGAVRGRPNIRCASPVARRRAGDWAVRARRWGWRIGYGAYRADPVHRQRASASVRSATRCCSAWLPSAASSCCRRRDPDLGAHRGVDRLEPQGIPARAAGRAGARAASRANFLFPFVTAVLVATGISLNIGGIVLMALGAQWYILFNVIAGASAIPNDLREAAANLRLPRIAVVAQADPARDLPELRHRRHHRGRRRLERVDRRRDRHLPRHHADRDRTRRLHQGRHRRR